VTTVGEILADGKGFDGVTVRVRGTVSRLVMRTSAIGKDYSTYSLCDGQCITVWIPWHPAFDNGSVVEVTGIYRLVAHAGAYTFPNQIEGNDAVEVSKP
jgi:hypothetical protein